MPYAKTTPKTKSKPKRNVKPKAKAKTKAKTSRPTVSKRNYKPKSQDIAANSQTGTFFMTQRVSVTREEYLRFLLSNGTILLNDSLHMSDYDAVRQLDNSE